MKTLRILAWITGGVVFLAVGWIPGLVILVFALGSTIRQALRLRDAMRPERLCPRGHAVAMYGIFRCRVCGAVSEGWAFSCPHCHAEYGYTSCLTCGLAVENTLTRGS